MDDKDTASSYAGRWVARLRGRIIAQGGTPELARRAAKSSRHKENPEIIYMPAMFSLHPLVDKVREILPDEEIYLVGGAVRDMFLNRLSPDLDFAAPSDGIFLARKVANALKADFLALDEERGTGRVLMTQEDGARIILDFATYRGVDLDADLRGRDFTINALAFDLHSQSILDPLEGGQDIRTRRIRACSPASFKDDPVRILRAVRQAAAFGFRIEKETRELMKQAVSQIERVSPERQRDELFRILDGPKPDAAMRALEMLGVFPHLLPELSAMKGVEQSEPHVHDVWAHTLTVLQYLENTLSALAIGYSADNTNDMFTGLLTLRIGRYREQLAGHFSKALNPERSLRALLFFTALYHDVQKPETKTIDETGRIRFFDHDVLGAQVAASRAEALHLSNDEADRVKTIVANHMRFHFFTSRMEAEKKGPSRKAMYRFFRDSGEAGVDLILLGLADLRGTRAHALTQSSWTATLDVARILLENYFEKPQETIAPPRLLNGHELMRDLDLESGPAIGQLLEAIREEQAIGKVETREQAFAFARTWMLDNEVEHE
jgi:tRNA nucleotidyltransferase/poly(A) polymerase